VLSQGEPRDAFWDHRKADDGLHIPYNNAGLIFKVSEEIAAENVSSIIFFDYIDNFVYFFSPCFFNFKFNYKVDCRYVRRLFRPILSTVKDVLIVDFQTSTENEHDNDDTQTKNRKTKYRYYRYRRYCKLKMPISYRSKKQILTHHCRNHRSKVATIG